MTEHNPITVRKNQAPGFGRSLDDYCVWLNGMGWVRASGKPYRIAVRDTGERYLDRAA